MRGDPKEQNYLLESGPLVVEASPTVLQESVLGTPLYGCAS